MCSCVIASLSVLCTFKHTDPHVHVQASTRKAHAYIHTHAGGTRFEQIIADTPDGAPRLVLMHHSITLCKHTLDVVYTHTSIHKHACKRARWRNPASSRYHHCWSYASTIKHMHANTCKVIFFPNISLGYFFFFLHFLRIDSKQTRNLLILVYYNPSTANLIQKKMYQFTKDQILAANNSIKVRL